MQAGLLLEKELRVLCLDPQATESGLSPTVDVAELGDLNPTPTVTHTLQQSYNSK